MIDQLDPEQPFFIAGGTGMVGSAINRLLLNSGFTNVRKPGRAEVDYLDREQTFEYILDTKPRYAVVAAAKVGGIIANDTKSADFISENLQIQVNVLDACTEAKVERLVFLGSSCIYPKFSNQPILEEYLMTGPLEPSNEAYAIAKIAGIHQVRAIRKQHNLRWITAQPCNLYGPGDNYDPLQSHVIPALIRRYISASQNELPNVTNWGSGTAMREFLHVDDLAEAILFLLSHYDSNEPINVGSGVEISIFNLAKMISRLTNFKGETFWDKSKPDGTPQKLLDNTKINELGWTPSIDLEEGLKATIGELPRTIFN